MLSTAYPLFVLGFIWTTHTVCSRKLGRSYPMMKLYHSQCSLKLIRDHGDIEGILKDLDRKKYSVPKDWIPYESNEDGEDGTDNDDNDDDKTDDGNGGTDVGKQNKDKENSPNGEDEKILPAYVQARELFHNHDVTIDVELKWTEPQSDELSRYLIEEHGFNPERVKSNIQKLEAAYKANRKPQARMDSFFAVKANPVADAKRKQRLEEEKKASNKKQKSTGAKGRGRK
jgi:flap endonuclease-1